MGYIFVVPLIPTKKAFVLEACEKLRLPKLHVGYALDSCKTDETRGESTIEDYHQLPMTRNLKRDNMWVARSAKPQLEFVVDNQPMAQLMNLDIWVNNPLYEVDIANVRQNLSSLYTGPFDYRGGFLNCFDWRPREYNRQADRVCNWI